MSISRKITEGAGSGSGGGSGGYVDDVFSTYLYEGTGADREIVNGVDLDGEGGMVWIKNRDDGVSNLIFDTERGGETWLTSNDADKATTNSGYHISSFNSDGFSLQNTGAGSNAPGKKYVSWTFRKAPSFFDVVTYTGNGVQNRAVPHGLGCTPGMVIIKSVSVSRDWHVWHNSFPEWTGGTTEGDVSGSNEVGRLQLSNDTAFLSGYGGFTYANDTAFGLYRSNLDENVVGEEYVAYVFAHDDSDEGLIQCGSYTGNGNVNGPEIDLGWEPQWLMIKSATTAQNWILVDTMRGTDGTMLKANEPDAENNQSGVIHVGANGFQLLSNNYNVNQGGVDYIYMAIRRPNRPAEEFEADELFAVDSRGTGSPPPIYRSGFVVDAQLQVSNISGSASRYVFDRLRGHTSFIRTDDSGKEESGGGGLYRQDQMEGIGSVAVAESSSDLSWMWRRAPGFFDVVAYDGTGYSGYVYHNLKAEPEMMWVKKRNASAPWAVYHKDTKGKALYLNEADSATDNQTLFGSTATAQEDWGFYHGDNPYVAENGSDFIAYLFASVPGICDIGSYTGTGDAQWIDCGFGASAPRFVLIKSTSVAGDWYYWDSLRGLVSGNSPYLLLNNTDAQVTNTNWISPSDGKGKTGGFLLNSSSSSQIYKDGVEYIYMAIA